jgi:hypothetical protein
MMRQMDVWMVMVLMFFSMLLVVVVAKISPHRS